MDNKTKILKALFVILLASITLPLLFTFVPQSKGPALFGIKQEKFSWRQASFNNIDTHQFQDHIEEVAKQNVGFCNWGVRFYNELNYKLFRYSDAPKLILGKQDCFYEDIYLREYCGQDFVGDSIIQSNLLKLKLVQTLLKQKYKVDLLWVIEPGKVRYMPEYIPASYLKNCKKETNYERYIYYAETYHIDYLDLNRYFRELKPTTEHPLYSRHGIHWSTYGMWTAADTLQHFIEQRTPFKLATMREVGHRYSAENNSLDFDLEPPMNLLFPAQHEQVYIPEIRFDEMAADKLPKVLLIADSYVWSLWDNGVPAHWFKEPQFWYYNITVYPNIWDNAVTADKRNLAKTLAQQDFILLMMTDANLRDFGWGCLDEMLDALK